MHNVARWSLLSGSVSLVILLAGCGSETPEVTTSREDSDGGAGSGVPSAPTQPAAMPGTAPAGNSTAAADPRAGATAGPSMKTPGGAPATGGPMAASPDYNAARATVTGNGTEIKPVSNFPEDVTEWTPDDFRKATQAGDQNLLKAIEHLVNDKPRDAEVAGLLAEMLELAGKSKSGKTGTLRGAPPAGAPPAGIAPPGSARPGSAAPGTLPPNKGSAGLRTPAAPVITVNAAFPPGGATGTPIPGSPTPGAAAPRLGIPGSPGFGGAGSGRGGINTSELVRAIVNGLARNGSQQAWVTLTNVLAGQIKTAVNDDMMAEWVLTAALENYGGESHPTHQLLEAAVQTPEDLNPRRSSEIKRQVTELLLNTAASVMDHLMGIPVDDPSQKSANGVGALDGRAGDRAAMTAASGVGAVAGSSPAVGDRGFNNGQQSNGFPRLMVSTRPLDDDAVRRVAQFLWRPEMLSFVEKETRRLIAVEDDVELLAFAGSLPMPGVRRSTFELLDGHWKSGAEPLLRQQLYQSIVRDPGLIVVLKLLPRTQPKRQTTGSGRSPKQRVSKSYRETQAKISWMRTSANMVLAVTKRLYVASQETDRPDLDPSDLPFKLHRDARIRGTYELNWPADVSDRVSGATAPGQLTVQYVRMEVDAGIAAKTFQFYKRQLKRSKDYSFPQGKWLDSLTTGVEPGTRRSVDVVVMKAAADSGAGGQQFRGNVGAAGKPSGGSGFGGNLPRSPNSGTGAYGTGTTGQQDNADRYTIDVLVIEIPNPKLAKGR